MDEKQRSYSTFFLSFMNQSIQMFHLSIFQDIISLVGSSNSWNNMSMVIYNLHINVIISLNTRLLSLNFGWSLVGLTISEVGTTRRELQTLPFISLQSTTFYSNPLNISCMLIIGFNWFDLSLFESLLCY
jgi:hypothetical protein